MVSATFKIFWKAVIENMVTMRSGKIHKDGLLQGKIKCSDSLCNKEAYEKECNKEELQSSSEQVG